MSDKSRDESRAEQRKMNMSRAPGVVVIAPRIRARLDGYEAVKSVLVCQGSSCSGEVRIKRRRVVVLFMRVPSRGIGLPDFNETIRYGAPIAIQNSSSNCDALSQRLPHMLNREVVISRTDIRMAEHWPRDLGKSMGQDDQRVRRRARPGRTIVGIKRIRLCPGIMPPEAETFAPVYLRPVIFVAATGFNSC